MSISHTTTGMATTVQAVAANRAKATATAQNTTTPTQKSMNTWIWATHVRAATGAVRTSNTTGRRRAGASRTGGPGGAAGSGRGGAGAGGTRSTYGNARRGATPPPGEPARGLA